MLKHDTMLMILRLVCCLVCCLLSGLLLELYENRLRQVLPLRVVAPNIQSHPARTHALTSSPSLRTTLKASRVVCKLLIVF
jgi:hypothetical protein